MPNIKEYSAPQIGVGGISGVSGSIGGVQNLRPNDAGLQAMEQAARTQGRFAAQEGDQLASVGRGMVRTAEAKATALRDVARGVEDLGNAVGYQVAQHQEQKATTEYFSKWADFKNGAIRDWNTTRAQADPNDPGVMDKFNEEKFGPSSANFLDAFSGAPKAVQRLAQERMSEFSEHLFTHQIADMSTSAREASVLNFTHSANVNADALRFDPSYYESTQNDTKIQIEKLASNPQLDATSAAHIRALGQETLRNNAKAAIFGMAEKNPEAAKVQLDSGFAKDVLTEEDRQVMDTHVQAMKRMRETQDRAAEVEQRRVQKETNDANANKLYASAIQPDGTLKPGPNAVGDLLKLAEAPGMEPSLLRAIHGAFEHALTQPPLVHSDSDLLQHFNERVLLPPGHKDALTLQQVFDAQGRNLLSDRDANRLRQEISEMPKDPVRVEALKQYQDWLGAQRGIILQRPMMGTQPPTPAQYQKWGDFQVTTRQAFLDHVANGTWRDTLKPGSASYLGSLQKSPGTALPAPTAPATTQPAVSIQDNEKPEDYLKRVRGE